MSRFINLVHQVSSRLTKIRGGTGNRYGWGTAVVESHANWSTTDDILLYTVVRLRNGALVEPTDTTDEVTVLGVIVGYIDELDRLIEDDVPPGGLAAVMTKGRCRVLLGADVDEGDYAFAHATDGTAYGSPTVAEGAFGVWCSNGVIPGSGGDSADYAEVELFGAPVFGAGGGPGGSFTDAQVEATFFLPYAGMEIHTRVPWDGDITGWVITGDEPTGDAEVDVWVDTFANYPPDVGDTITASDLPTLTSDDHDSGAATGWTLGLTKGDWMVFHVNSVSGHQRLSVAIALDRTS